MRCQSCGRESPSRARFCGHCGAVIQAPSEAPARSPSVPEPAETVMLPRVQAPAAHPSPPPYHPSPDPTRHDAGSGPPPAPTPDPYAPWQAPSNGWPASAGPPTTQQYPPVQQPPPSHYPPTPYPPPAQYPTTQPPPAMQQPPGAPYAPRSTQQGSAPRKRWPTPVLLIVGLIAAAGAALLVLLGVGTAVSTRATPTPTVAVATAKPASATATAKPAAAPSPTPIPSPTPVPSPTRVPVSLANGTDITPPAPGPAGLGTLTIKNGTNRDAVAKLVTGTADPKTWQTQRFVYVKANDTVVMEGVRVGTYRLAFMSGVDWDEGARKFLRDVSASQFDETFEFEEEQTERGTRFSTWNVSLNPVAGGTGKTTNLPEGAFGPE